MNEFASKNRVSQVHRFVRERIVQERICRNQGVRRHGHGPCGFTLLELLLTLVVIAAIASVALPGASMLLADRKLVRGGDQLRVEMTRLRVDAMRQGRVMMIEAMIEGNKIRMRPYFSASDSTEAIDQTGSQSGMLTGAAQSTATAIVVDESATKEIELGEGLLIKSVQVASAARGAEINQATMADQGEGWGQPILFYPDGTTSTAAVTIADETFGKVVVKLRGITGDVTVTEVLP